MVFIIFCYQIDYKFKIFFAYLVLFQYVIWHIMFSIF